MEQKKYKKEKKVIFEKENYNRKKVIKDKDYSFNRTFIFWFIFSFCLLFSFLFKGKIYEYLNTFK